jgi:hypothetical protein
VGQPSSRGRIEARSFAADWADYEQLNAWAVDWDVK